MRNRITSQYQQPHPLGVGGVLQGPGQETALSQDVPCGVCLQRMSPFSFSEAHSAQRWGWGGVGAVTSALGVFPSPAEVQSSHLFQGLWLLVLPATSH